MAHYKLSRKVAPSKGSVKEKLVELDEITKHSFVHLGTTLPKNNNGIDEIESRTMLINKIFNFVPSSLKNESVHRT